MFIYEKKNHRISILLCQRKWYSLNGMLKAFDSSTYILFVRMPLCPCLRHSEKKTLLVCCSVALSLFVLLRLPLSVPFKCHFKWEHVFYSCDEHSTTTILYVFYFYISVDLILFRFFPSSSPFYSSHTIGSSNVFVQVFNSNRNIWEIETNF